MWNNSSACGQMTIHMRKSAWPLMTEKYSKVCDLSRILSIHPRGKGSWTLTTVAEIIVVELLLLNDFEPKNQ